MNPLRLAAWMALVVLGGTFPTPVAGQPEASEKPVLVVTTDIGGDPDDRQSLVRLLLYANEFDIRGIIASASGTPGELGVDTVRDDLVRNHIMAYGKVLDMLRDHDPGYPSAEDLQAVVKRGNPRRGEPFVGEGQDTEGSDWIVRTTDEAGDRPVHVAVWGGQTDLVQALWKVKHERSEEDFNAFVSRLRVYDINDQDGLYGFIRREFPGLFYILAAAPEGQDKREGAYRGMYLGGVEELTSRDWIDSNVRSDHGPLGALYPPETWTEPNPHGALKEGDTPSWFYFLETGLQDPEHPEWGGWGGRFKEVSGRFYRDDPDFADMDFNARATVSRWRPQFQNDFQARLDWCVKPHGEANHPPVAVVMGDDTREVVHVDAMQGEEVVFSALDSYDLDGDKLDFAWWTYPEAGTNLSCPSLEDNTSPEVRFTVPSGASGVELHLICEVTDQGQPSLTRCRRIVLHIF
ncbi:MAG: DUF1593 domain-containing protein [Bacteroidales bacterium]